MTTSHPTPYNVFVIDDDVFLLDMYATKFSQKDFSVTSASGTIEALEKLRGGFTPDVIVWTTGRHRSRARARGVRVYHQSIRHPVGGGRESIRSP